jgi:hypothetical protein
VPDEGISNSGASFFDIFPGMNGALTVRRSIDQCPSPINKVSAAHAGVREHQGHSHEDLQALAATATTNWTGPSSGIRHDSSMGASI